MIVIQWVFFEQGFDNYFDNDDQWANMANSTFTKNRSRLPGIKLSKPH